LPRADDVPPVVSELDQSQPCTHNPLGAKGCGESGAIGAPAAVVSEILDALAPIGVDDLEMPATPDRVWRTIRDARARRNLSTRMRACRERPVNAAGASPVQGGVGTPW